MAINADELMRYAGTLEGEVIFTAAQHRGFTVDVTKDGFHFVPMSSKKIRRENLSSIRAILEHYDQSGSLYPRDYRDKSQNASYVLTLLRRFIGHSTNSNT